MEKLGIVLFFLPLFFFSLFFGAWIFIGGTLFFLVYTIIGFWKGSIQEKKCFVSQEKKCSVSQEKKCSVSNEVDSVNQKLDVPVYDYRVNLNKLRCHYEADIKFKQQDVKFEEKPASFHSPTFSDESDAHLVNERSKVQADKIKSKPKISDPQYARECLKVLRDNIANSKEQTSSNFTCSISPEITQQNRYWNYLPNTVELTFKQKGDMFEQYVIHKFDPNYFVLVEMRSDKGSNGVYPESTIS